LGQTAIVFARNDDRRLLCVYNW